MARLPGMGYLMQQIDGLVILFEDGSEREIVRFDPADGIAVQNALEVIRASELSEEDACFALVWAGYFHAYAGPDPEVPGEVFVTETRDGAVQVLQNGWTEIARFDPHSMDAVAQAQLPIHLSGLSQPEKDRAHFWSGFFYGQACQ